MTLNIEKTIESYVKNITIKQILIVPAILLLLSLSILSYTYLKTGSPVGLGVEFSGGTVITFDSTKSPDQLKEEFRSFPLIQAREEETGNRRILQFGQMNEIQLNDLTTKINSEYTKIEINKWEKLSAAHFRSRHCEPSFYHF